MSFALLPPELYSAILDHLDDETIQPTILSLTRALPFAVFPLDRFFERIKLGGAERVVQLHRRLRGGVVEACYVQELRIETWTADPQVIINLLELLENVRSIAIFIGPNFGPENLLEIFERPRERLESLSLRFRPYLQRANYYHFLKGAYFDTTISAIANWPASSLRSLSIVQDPLDQQGSFAQPLVFFTFQPFSLLSVSPASRNITALRIRIPSRDAAVYLSGPRAFPTLRALDVSTGNIRDQRLLSLLTRFDRVEHVRADACAMIAGHEPSDWVVFGKDCALIGVMRARSREKILKAWKERQQANLQLVGRHDVQPIRVRARPGRKGLATATISLRGAAEPPNLPYVSEISESSTSAAAQVNSDPILLNRKIRIVPLPPSLLTLTTTAPSPSPGTDLSDYHASLCQGFNEGWEAGISQLRASWMRLRTSSRYGSSVSANSVVVMAMVSGAEPEAPALDGLQEVDEERWETLMQRQYPPPTLCLAGEGEVRDEKFAEFHPRGCGHQATSSLWGDPAFLRMT